MRVYLLNQFKNSDFFLRTEKPLWAIRSRWDGAHNPSRRETRGKGKENISLEEERVEVGKSRATEEAQNNSRA